MVFGMFFGIVLLLAALIGITDFLFGGIIIVFADTVYMVVYYRRRIRIKGEEICVSKVLSRTKTYSFDEITSAQIHQNSAAKLKLYNGDTMLFEFLMRDWGSQTFCDDLKKRNIPIKRIYNK